MKAEHLADTYFAGIAILHSSSPSNHSSSNFHIFLVCSSPRVCIVSRVCHLAPDTVLRDTLRYDGTSLKEPWYLVSLLAPELVSTNAYQALIIQYTIV